MIELNSLKVDRISEIDKLFSDLTVHEYKVHIKYKTDNVTCVDFNKKTRTLRISLRYHAKLPTVISYYDFNNAFSVKFGIIIINSIIYNDFIRP